jgi:predicted RNase H-like HicB family nuclease
MSKRTYIAMFETDAEGGYGITFPDLPGCVSYGDTLEQAARNAEEALSLHLEGMAEDGVALPEPSSIGAVFDIALRDVVWTAVTVEAPDASERVNIYMPKSLLERVDRYAAENGLNRSAAMAMAASRLVERAPSAKEAAILGALYPSYSIDHGGPIDAMIGSKKQATLGRMRNKPAAK